MVSFHGEATADGVRHGRDRGKLIFTFDGGPDHPLCRVGSKWKKPRGIEVFYGNGLPSILGQYGDDGDQYRLEGTLGKAPDWLVESLTPRQSKQTRCRERVPTMNPAEQREALTGLPLLLAELCPELGNPSVGWRLKDFSGGTPAESGRAIWVGRCPFEHDSGRSEDGDLDAGYHDDGPYVRCLHGSCGRIQDVNRQLKEQHRREHPPGDTSDRSGPDPSAIPPAAGGSADDGETQAQSLLRIAAIAVLYHSADGRAYMSVPINGHLENHEVRSTGFKRWLTRSFFQEKGRPPSSDAMQGALGVIEAKAIYDGGTEEVYVRIAPRGSSVYLDLGDASWRSVEIRPDGWNIVDTAPVRFRRPPGLRPLPAPAQGGTIDRLKDFARLDDAQFLLVVAWLAASLRPTGPYPILVLIGEQGSAKSTLARVLRQLCDPHVSLLRSEPREPRDLMIGAVNGWVLALDNLSTMSAWLSDSLCRLSTGGGFATRTLYSNDEETFLDAQRPIILNGITDFVGRGDLIDRCVFLHLPPIPEGERRTETRFWADFETEFPRLLGALLDTVVGGLRMLPQTKVSSVPRMADFAIFGEAVCQALGHLQGKFLTAYRDNRQAANESALEDSPVGVAIRELASRGKWTGTASELMDALAGSVPEKIVKSDRWPKGPRGVSGVLHRLAPLLRMVDVQVSFDRAAGGSRRRTIIIESTGNQPSQPSRPSPPASFPEETRDGRAGQPSPTVPQPSRTNPEKTESGDGRDGRDGQIPTLSGDPPF